MGLLQEAISDFPIKSENLRTLARAFAFRTLVSTVCPTKQLCVLTLFRRTSQLLMSAHSSAYVLRQPVIIENIVDPGQAALK